MSTTYEEVVTLNGETTNVKTKDVIWKIHNEEYAVRNVPYIMLDEEVLSPNVSLKLTLIRDLMFDNEIPHDVNFNDVVDIAL